MKRYIALFDIFAAFLSPYTLGWNWDWWKFIPATAAIIASCRVAAPTSYQEILGIKITPKLIYLSLAIGLITFFFARTMIDSILLPLGFIHSNTSKHLGWRYLSVFQVLNEEMIFRATALNFLVEKLKGEFKANLAGATIFAGLHYALYQFGPESDQLTTSAIISLFAFALACNEFFLMTKSIAIPYAMHLGWNIHKFGNYWIFSSTGEPLSEARGFNLIEGDFTVMISSLSLGLLSIWIARSRVLLRDRKTN